MMKKLYYTSIQIFLMYKKKNHLLMFIKKWKLQENGGSSIMIQLWSQNVK